MPSSGWLVDRLLEAVDFSSARTIVELGPGTGCVTREILRRMRPDAQLLSLEVNPVFVEQCHRLGDPRLMLRRACASRLPAVLEEEGLRAVDVVVSSLPLGLMSDDLVHRILHGSRSSLHPDGTFIQYQYSLSRYDQLRTHYPSVAVGFVPINVPPAFVYTCSKRPGAGDRVRRKRPSLAFMYAGVLTFAATIAQAFHSR